MSDVEREKRNDNKFRNVVTYYEDVWLERLERRQDGSCHYGLHVDGMSTKPKINTNRLIDAVLTQEMDPEHPHVCTNVLDLGCGLGETMRHLEEKHGQDWLVRGICSSPKESRTGNAISKARGYRGYSTVFDFNDRSLDAHECVAGDEYLGLFHGVYAIESLCQAWDRQATLAWVSGWLKPGGVFVVLDARLEGDVPEDRTARPGENSTADLYQDILWGFQVPDLYEKPLSIELIEAGFTVSPEVDYTTEVAESMFESAGRARYELATRRVPMRMQKHYEACIGMAGLLAHGKLRYSLNVARKEREE